MHHRCGYTVHTLAIHAASHVNHEKRDVWFSISMRACGSVPMVMVLCLAALQAVRVSLLNLTVCDHRLTDTVLSSVCVVKGPQGSKKIL